MLLNIGHVVTIVESDDVKRIPNRKKMSEAGGPIEPPPKSQPPTNPAPLL
jgi:hypothetical protein